MRTRGKLELLFWGVALPGFAQLLNGRYVKGIVLVFLEFLVNVKGNFNEIIILSFHGRIEEAVQQTNYAWLMFYPCLYFFAIWDGYQDGEGPERPYFFLPFVFSAYFVTVGVIFSSNFRIFGRLIGPVWLPILTLPLGLAAGFLVRSILLSIKNRQT